MITEKLTEARVQLQKEELHLVSRLEAVRNALRGLDALNANGTAPAASHDLTPATAALKARGGQKNASGKSPQGELQRAILAALKTTKKQMTNGELRDYLTGTGYQWSLTPLHVSKTLTKLVKAKKVKGEGNIVNRRYRLA